jgi:hypothetical protein
MSRRKTSRRRGSRRRRRSKRMTHRYRMLPPLVSSASNMKQNGQSVRTAADALIAYRAAGKPATNVFEELQTAFNRSEIVSECPEICTVNDVTDVTTGHLHDLPKQLLYPGDRNYNQVIPGGMPLNEWLKFCQSRDCALPNPLCKFPYTNHVCSKCGRKVA